MDHKRRGSGLSHHSFVRYNRKTTSRFSRFPSPRWLCHVSTVTQNSCRVVGENDKIRCHQVSSEGSPDLCRYRGNPTDRFAASKLGSAVVQALFFREVIKHTKADGGMKTRQWSRTRIICRANTTQTGAHHNKCDERAQPGEGGRRERRRCGRYNKHALSFRWLPFHLKQTSEEQRCRTTVH